MAYRGHVVDVGLLHHGQHGQFDGAVLEFVVGVFVPDGLEVEVGAVHDGLEEAEVAGVRDGIGGVVEVLLEGGREAGGLAGIVVLCELLGAGGHA